MSRFLSLVTGLAALAVVAPGTWRAAAQESSPAASAGAVPPIIADYAAALNAHDVDRVAALYTDDAEVEQAVRDGNVFRGREEIAGLVANNLQGIPDLTVTTENVIAEGDRIAWAWVYDGAYTGQFPGLPAGRGQPIALRGVSLFEVRDGLIQREVIYFDNDAFLSQAGALTAPGTSESGTPAP